MTSLNLSHNESGNDISLLARMLEKNKTIRELDLRHTNLGSLGVRHLLTCLNNNVFLTELHLEETPAGTQENPIGLAHLERVDKIMQSNKNFQLVTFYFLLPPPPPALSLAHLHTNA